MRLNSFLEAFKQDNEMINADKNIKIISPAPKPAYPINPGQEVRSLLYKIIILIKIHEHTFIS